MQMISEGLHEKVVSHPMAGLSSSAAARPNSPGSPRHSGSVTTTKLPTRWMEIYTQPLISPPPSFSYHWMYV
ncbi:hypothetical protein BDV30DRAFT_212556 [Aspergillus minisclerotigenes]|uniref:Uncharacterized protein n=1 Tax=Aspergillus minisclerotigenes TaxID=656917 RepID=A0A5N6IZG0_9EURO|nr:hypothetical protein BDV30DRAFT_212556 [Aspergillus minisclerotigenes]